MDDERGLESVSSSPLSSYSSEPLTIEQLREIERQLRESHPTIAARLDLLEFLQPRFPEHLVVDIQDESTVMSWRVLSVVYGSQLLTGVNAIGVRPTNVLSISPDPLGDSSPMHPSQKGLFMSRFISMMLLWLHDHLTRLLHGWSFRTRQ